MISLPNNCRRGEFSYHPANWLSHKAKLTDDWYCQCRFYDPRFINEYSKGKQVRVRGLVNQFKTLAERRSILEKSVKDMEDLLANGYNPITGEKVSSVLSSFYSEGTSTHKSSSGLKGIIAELKLVVARLEDEQKNLEQVND